jgi:hypothetical protein
MFEDLLLARGTAQYYALEQLMSQHLHRRQREPKHYLRRGFAWLRRQIAAQRSPIDVKVQGCG